MVRAASAARGVAIRAAAAPTADTHPPMCETGSPSLPLAGGQAILRHVARKFGLYGGDEEDASFVDMVGAFKRAALA